MAGEAEGLDLEIAPANLVRVRGQVPLRLPALDPPPGEDQAVDDPRLEDSQPRGPGWSGEGSGDALTGGIELKAMEGADEPAIADTPPRGGPQIGAQVRANGLGDADAPVLFTPDDDVLAHPGLLDEPSLQDGPAACDEIPAFGKRRRQRSDRGFPTLGWHPSILLTRNLGLPASIAKIPV